VRTVSRISITPVQGFALTHPQAVELGEHGVLEDRRFFLTDDRGNRVRSSLSAWTCLVGAAYEPREELLRVSLPSGAAFEAGALGNGTEVAVEMGSGRTIRGRMVRGGWEGPLAELAGHPVRIVRSDVPGARQNAPASILSEASVERLAEEAGRPVDGRRFRMLFTLAGCRPHEEDEWQERRLRVGDTVLRVGGPIVRCAVTTRDPGTGERDLDTLRLIAGYRGRMSGEDVHFGVYAHVEQPGTVRVGDAVETL
jgi:uncharacterized protein YcbX